MIVCIFQSFFFTKDFWEYLYFVILGFFSNYGNIFFMKIFAFLITSYFVRNFDVLVRNKVDPSNLGLFVSASMYANC